MSTKYKVHDNSKAHFITITTVGWIDLFTRNNHRTTITDALIHCQQKKGLELYAWVLMPSHLHLLCRSQEGYELSAIMRDFKKHTAQQLIQNIKTEPESRREWLLEQFSKACAHLSRSQQYKVWQNGYHAEEVFSNKFIYQKLNYIHQNPVADGIVQQAHEYYYSSARNYAGLDSPVEVVLIPPQLITYS